MPVAVNLSFVIEVAASSAPNAYPLERLWSGDGVLYWNPPGVTANPRQSWTGGRLQNHSDYENASAEQELRLNVSMLIDNRPNDRTYKEKWLQDRGPLETKFYKLANGVPGASGYKLLDYVRGRISGASVTGDVLTFTIERALERYENKPAEYMDMVYIGKLQQRLLSWPP